VITNDGDSMIQLCAAFISCLHDARSNIVPVASTESDVHWLLGNNLFHHFHRSLGKSRVLFDFAHSIVEFMLTFFKFFPFILIVAFSHGTVVFQEIKVILHPAALAAPAPVVFVFLACVFKMLFIVYTTSLFRKSAVNTLLRRELDGISSRLDGEGAFKCRSDGKSPA